MSVNVFPNEVVYTKPPKYIHNAFNGTSDSAAGLDSLPTALYTIIPTTFVADSWVNALTVSGGGFVYRAVAYNNLGGTRSVGLQIILDNVTVFEATAPDCDANEGVIGIGSVYSNQLCPFESSCVINLKNDTSDNNSVALGILYAVL